ncbi:hypothetical protein J6590_102414 [Homalodisca vitripennis]|nr:hypothetical protein J6590_102414 [Homalodisca vitripennis]
MTSKEGLTFRQGIHCPAGKATSPGPHLNGCRPERSRRRLKLRLREENATEKPKKLGQRTASLTANYE